MRRSTSPGSTTSSSLSAEVDTLLTSIMELPVTSTIKAELDEEELAWDDNDVCIAKGAMVKLPGTKQTPSSSLSSCELPGSALSHTGASVVTSLLDELLISVVAMPPIAKSPRKPAPVTGPFLWPSKEEWLEDMLDSIDELAAQYTPHPLPYEGPPGILHSADVHPPSVDFTALGFNSRRLPTPMFHPIHGCSPTPGLDQSEAFPFGALTGLLTNNGVIQVPRQLFGFEYVPGTAGKYTTWMMCAN